MVQASMPFTVQTVWPQPSLWVSRSGRAHHAWLCASVKTVGQVTSAGAFQAAAANDA